MQDGPVVVLLVHQVHRAAGLLFAGGQHRLVHVPAVKALTAELGQKRRMDVQTRRGNILMKFGSIFNKNPARHTSVRPAS